jgi:hypothetical protein
MSEKIVTALETPPTRREVMKKAAYIAPAILTLPALPAFASKGSGWNRSSGGSGKSFDGQGSLFDLLKKLIEG